MMAIPVDKPIRVAAFKWHNADYDKDGNYIGAIQIILENGCASPVFRAARQSVKDLTQVDVGFKVRKITGTHHGNCIS